MKTSELVGGNSTRFGRHSLSHQGRLGDAIRFDGTDDVLEGRLGSDSVSRDLTIFVVHRRLEEKSGVGPLSFSLPMIAGEAESVDGALALVWGNTWSEPTRTLAGGIGMVTTGPGGTQWRGPAVAAGAGASVPGAARAGFQITTLVKSGTEHVGPGEWTYSSDLKVRHRNERGVGESTQTLTMTASWRAAGYALGRLLVASGQGSGYLKGDIAEIVVCLGVVEEGRRQAVEDYLARRYFAKERSNFRYTGHYYHAKSGLHLAPYRAYDAKHGVWLSEDPIQEEGGINLYGYVGNSPLRKMDPLGLFGYDADGSVNWFSVGDDVCDIAKNGLGTGVMQALDGLNPFDDPFANGGWIPEGADTNYAAQIAGYTNPAGLGLRGAQGLGLANALAKSKALGLGSKILGRGGKFGNKGKANANNLCRVGWSWMGSSQAGKNVLRMATGKPLKSGPQWLRSLWDKVRHMDILE